MTLASNIRGTVAAVNKKFPPPWKGPESNDPQGGISQSLIGRFLACRTRFGLYVHEGLKSKDTFNAKIEFGNFWHLAEEKFGTAEKGYNQWDDCILEYCKLLMNRYPMDREKVAHWYQMCKDMFPVYRNFWKNEEKREKRKVLFTERVFSVPYKLPSGRTVYLRGKWDGGSSVDHQFWLDEHKSKSQIDGIKIGRQLKFDLQTMTYLVALHTDRYGSFLNEHIPKGAAIGGVRYNVVRRSAHKTSDSALKKINEDIADGRGGEWFGRWCVPVSSRDIEVFRKTCLDPVLENICIWWDVMNGELVSLSAFRLQDIMNFRHPYGVYNPADMGADSEYDFYLDTGDKSGLERVRNLFPELQAAA